MRLLSLLLASGMIFAGAGAWRTASHRAEPGTVIIDASDFVQHMPARNMLTEARPVSEATWLFNNSGMILRAAEPVLARVQMPEAGTYHRRMRPAGAAAGSFKVDLGGRVSPATFGGMRPAWVEGGSFELPAGPLEVRLTDITPSPILDVLVLMRGGGFAEADLRPM